MSFIPLEKESEKKSKTYPKQNTKKGRIIIRNVSFKATDDKVRDHFAQFGEIQEVRLLRKPDGNLIGCGFVQFSKVPDAAKAIKECNAKPFLGRKIAVDWAIPKTQYAPKTVDTSPAPGEEVSDSKDVKEEEKDVAKTVKKEEDASAESESDGDGDEEQDDETEEVQDEEEEDEDDEEVEDEEDNEKDEADSSHTKPSDVNEGKTVFLRNLDFSTTEESLKKFVDQYGPYHYALLCMDPVMERPKGTAFVKFKSPESAQKCMEAAEKGVVLDGRQINATLAMSREDLAKKFIEDKKNKQKDNRNLFLAREGLVRAGTRAAQGVSAADMAKRQQIEVWKRQMLRNLNMYISKERLCIHNLPLSYTDKQLRTLLIKHAPKGAKITEARVMKDMKKLGEDNKPLSKGYGFVTFQEHDHALSALRALNNNPSVFSPNKRPIVEFSVENRAALVARAKRTEKSKEKRQSGQEVKQQTPSTSSGQKSAAELAEYVGAKADPKVKGLPSHMGPKIRHKKRGNAAAEVQRKPKITRKMLKDPAKRKRRMPDQADVPVAKKRKNNRKQTVTKFDRMVDDYRQKNTVPSTNQKKWFE